MKSLLLALALISAPAYAQGSDEVILPAGHSAWTGAPVQGPIHVRVNLRTQMAYVYSGKVVIGETSVSTGRDGFETAPGHFTVLGKETNHFSQHYKANMPYTMWFNDQGEALHGGGDPGSPSSHGCVHMPLAFVSRLYTMMQVGDRVDIVDKAPAFSLNL